MVRSLGLKAGDKLVAELIDDRIVLLPRPDSWAEYMIGSLEGVYGSSKEEVDRYIAEVRYGSDGYGLNDALDRTRTSARSTMPPPQPSPAPWPL